ncbi:MAG TPA: HAD-IB family hydrolase [Deltaproteobacteria bacterium]|jgi:HAD superfamily hydrolase (TIGR01490 family)|nr:HAD-IB family hydrolase [Deltaproteobacteria bacterium]HOI06853.1 HAD-IB family hydrolase [Deltaproteobacteria bacterium]
MGTRPIGAFFDFDRTLLDENSPKLGIRYLWDRGQVSLPYVLKVAFANWFYQKDLISETLMARFLLSYYRGRDLAPFEQGAGAYYEEVIKPHLAPNIVSRVKAHRELGHVLIMISAGVRYLLKPVVQDLGFHHLVCTDLKVGSSGLLTGTPDGFVCSGINKKHAALAISRELDLDLGHSYAYGDHHSDLFFLEMVGNPHAVEPTHTLRREARKRGWPILTYR